MLPKEEIVGPEMEVETGMECIEQDCGARSGFDELEDAITFDEAIRTVRRSWSGFCFSPTLSFSLESILRTASREKEREWVSGSFETRWGNPKRFWET